MPSPLDEAGTLVPYPQRDAIVMPQSLSPAPYAADQGLLVSYNVIHSPHQVSKPDTWGETTS